MKIGIIVAMDKEYDQLAKVFAARKDIVIQKCGIGKVNSAIGTVEMINHHYPDLIISSGCAGGADTSLNVMDVVVASECTYHDAYCGDDCEYGQIMGMPARYQAPEEYVKKALELNDETVEGNICRTLSAVLPSQANGLSTLRTRCAPYLSTSPRLRLLAESCSIAQTCYRYGVPFVSFRVISDVPIKDTKASQYFDFWDKVAQDSFEVTKRFVDKIYE